MTKFKTALSATALGFVLLQAPAAFADGHSQLIETVTNSMAELGVEPAGFETLSVEELAEIKVILDTSDPNQAKVDRIEQVITTKAEASGESTEAPAVFLITNDLRDQIENDLGEMGYEVEGDDLTVQQLAEIKAVLSGDRTSEAAKGRIEAALEM